MSLRSRIDDAFNRAISNSSSVRRDPDVAALAGGFLLEDSEQQQQPSHIPLSCIPHALQLLDLPPDDDQVLAVFRNAATGWGEAHSSSLRSLHRRPPRGASEDNDVAEQLVSLEDWRAVCAAIMNDGGDGVEEEENLDATGGEDLSSELEESSGGGSSDEYRVTEAASRKRSRKSAAATQKTRVRKTRSAAARRGPPPSPSTSAEITPRQRRECLQTFLLFFPDVPEEQANRRRLGVREVNTAATVLNEKLKTEEVRSVR